MQRGFKQIAAILLFSLLTASAGFAQTDNSTYIYTGQIFVPDNGTPTTGDFISLFPNPAYNPGSGWHDVEIRFGTVGDSQSTDSGTMNLFRPLNPTGTTSADSGSIPEPASVLLLALPVFLRRRRVRAQTV